MGNAVLISIRPEWCYLIAIGRKTLELRKAAPNLRPPYKVYIYCTKAKSKSDVLTPCNDLSNIYNGKVIGECTCDAIVPIRWQNYAVDYGIDEGEYNVSHLQLSAACVTEEELLRYGNGKDLSALHIVSPKIYDKPKELGEFYRWIGWTFDAIERAPQSWCYVEELI